MTDTRNDSEQPDAAHQSQAEANVIEQTPASAPAGWYPAGVEGEERYWDGAAWSAQTRPLPTATSDTPASAEPTPTSAGRAWYKRKSVLIPAGVLAGLIVISGVATAVNGGSREIAAEERPAITQVEEVAASDVEVPDTTGLTAKEAQALLENAGLEVEFSADEGIVIDRDNWTVLGTIPAAGATAASGDTVVVNVEKTAKAAVAEPQESSQPAPAPAEPAPAPDMSLAQANAVGSAQSYLNYSGFSRAGLAQQLTSEYGEGFLPEDAEFAIAYLEQTGQVDWNAEAVESAKSYLDYSSFSRQGLFEQLTSEYGENFTADQANHALNQIGL